MKINWNKFLAVTTFTSIVGTILIYYDVCDITVIYWSILFNLLFAIKKEEK